MTGERLGRRGLHRLRQQLSDRDMSILVDVSALKLMSARHIEALHFDEERHASATTAARTCRRVLERLVALRALVRLDRTVGGVRGGSSSYIYAIGPVGQRLIKDRGPRRRFREPTITFVRHTLAIAELVVSLRQAERARELDVLQLQVEPECWRSSGVGSTNVLRPDLFVALGVGEYEHHSFVEVDLGTEAMPRLLAKCQLYDAYFQTGREQAEHQLFPRVIWLLNDEHRAVRLRDTIDHSRTLTHDLFVVASLGAPLGALTGDALTTEGVP